METLDGVISRILYHKPSKWSPAGTPYLIARLASGATVKGECRKPVEGQLYRFFGSYKPQRGRDEHAFEFESFEAIVDRSEAGSADYLATHVDGIGRIKATALANHFGADTLDVLRTDPDRALEVTGITDRIIEAIRQHFAEITIDPRAHAKLIDLFNQGDHRVSKRVVKALLQDFRSDAPAKILENPYILLAYPGIGWKTADSFAMTTAKYDPQGLERHKAAIVEAIEQVTLEGHTFALKPEIVSRVYKLIDAEPRWDAWHALLTEQEVAGDGERYSLPSLWEAEQTIASRLACLETTARPLKFNLDPDDLAGDQLTALDVIQENGVCLLIGPPGCGKSYLVARVIKSLARHGIRSIRVVAPTGKAAKRAAELLTGAGLDINQFPCTTIHKALGPVPSMAREGVPDDSAKVGRGRDGFGFTHNEDNTLDVNVLIVDETSMVDVRLGNSLLSAIATGTRVLFVGDQNQLPSVGPGSMLRDLIEAGLPTAELTEIKRSDGGGRVVRACHAIKDGREPQPAVALMPPTENWIHIEESDPNRIAATIVELHELASRFDPVWDYQVVSAQKAKHAFACENLNRLLSLQLNPPPAEDAEPNNEIPVPFRFNDKIIRRKNGVVGQLKPATEDEIAEGGEDWRWDRHGWNIDECAVVNGDMGTVLDVVIEERQSWVIVRFRDPERLCRIAYSDHHLQQAYAITVHSAQGSGFPVVIVPVHTAFYWDARTGQGLFNRELLYTAISRAEQVLVTVGQWAAVRAAIGRQTVHRRRTRLADLLRTARIQAAFKQAEADSKQTEADAEDVEAETEELINTLEINTPDNIEV